MSHTKHGGKSPWFEYWTARPGNDGGGQPGRDTKRRTHRAERRLNKPATTGRLARRFGHRIEDDAP